MYGRDYERGMNRGWDDGFSGGGYGMRGYDRGWNDRDRVTFGPRGHFGGRNDRDLGDQLREGWHDLKRGVRNAIGGGGYDRGYYGGDRGRYSGDRGFFGGGRGYSDYRTSRGGYRGYGRGYDRGWF